MVTFFYFVVHKVRLLLFCDGEAIEYKDRVDIDRWCRRLLWDENACISLSVGQNPKKVKGLWHRFSAGFKQEYIERMVVLRQAMELGVIPSQLTRTTVIFPFSLLTPLGVKVAIKPLHFVIWAKQQGWELFVDLERLVRKYADTAGMDFEAKCMELEIENSILKQREIANASDDANPLGARREESYQKLIAGLARIGRPNLEAINAHKITDQLSSLDLPFDMISEDTIRTLLEPSRRLLGIKGVILAKKTLSKK